MGAPTMTLELAGSTYRAVDLPAVLGEHVDRLPYVLRLLAENIAREADGDDGERQLAALRAWGTAASSHAELSFRPGRLLMHDTTSTPALVDIAAMRTHLAAAGHDPRRVSPRLPVEVSIDHSLAVEAYARADAAQANLGFELRRNAERFAFLKWAASAMDTVRLNPPGTGIMHTINLEQLSSVVATGTRDGERWAFPDTMLGTDSHTPMVNGLGVLGWGIGGLEAELVMLGFACTLAVPEVVGVRLVGRLGEGVGATDLALTVTHELRQLGVTGDFVEFHGPGVSSLTVGQRAVVANMAPEYGATTGYFPIDAQSIEYLATVAQGRVEGALVEQYARANHLWFDPSRDPTYTRTLQVDLALVERSVAGPTRPQDQLRPSDIAAAVAGAKSIARQAGSRELPARPVALAAITSCTNTTDPRLLVAAGLFARKAVQLGLKVAPWVKTSLAPGSPAAQRYLSRTGLLQDLADLGFDIVGFGCTTCIGNSGELPPAVESARRAGTAAPVAILSGNRNFPGRVHPDIEASFIMSPALVVAFALLGDAAQNVETAPLGYTPNGQPVLLDELWPTDAEVDAELAAALRSEDFPAAFAQARASESWRRLPSATSALYPWADTSTILQPPPFASAEFARPVTSFTAHPLLVLGDDVTTDHISPASAIPADSPVAEFLVERGEDRADLNVFASRRGNWQVMVRGAFYAKSLVNALAPGAPTGTTTHASGARLEIFDAAQRYSRAGQPVVVIAGERYGMGSSRDWAAKAQALLGVCAVLAASFERIHRTNLVGMGILPLVLPAAQRARLGEVQASDRFEVEVDAAMLAPRAMVPVRVTRATGVPVQLYLQAAVETEEEVALLRAGGAIPFILNSMATA